MSGHGERADRRSTASRCATPGCGRFVRAGQLHCGRHQAETAAAGEDLPLAEQTRAAIAASVAAQQERQERARRARRFRERLEGGNYRALFDDYLATVIAQAAAEQGVREEIGALRLVLARLLVEEEDLSKLAANVARVASVAVQAARAQRAITGEVAQTLTEALTRILIELDED